MKKYKIRLLMHSGTTQAWSIEIIEAKYMRAERNYYAFELKDKRMIYYPINNTIVEELLSEENKNKSL